MVSQPGTPETTDSRECNPSELGTLTREELLAKLEGEIKMRLLLEKELRRYEAREDMWMTAIASKARIGTA